jgi:type IV pilus assembly protein PilN
MRLPINLAREPFRRDRPILVASAATAVLLLITLAVLVSLIVTDRNQTQQMRADLNKVMSQLGRIRSEQASIDRTLHQPENEIVLDRSIMINSLIRRKAISWTRIFSDLGEVLPWNVRIIAIRPQLNARDQLSLDMTVASDTPEPVIGFMAKLEESDLFGAVTPSGITPPTQNDPFYRYRLTVIYAQKL